MAATSLGAVRKKRADLVHTIRKYIFAGDTSVKEVAPKVGMTCGTLYRRLAAPGDFTVDELRRLSTALHIPRDELLPFLL